MRPELEKAFEDVSNQLAMRDPVRPGEWKCRLCGGRTLPNGPMIHRPNCQLSVLYEALEAGEGQ